MWSHLLRPGNCWRCTRTPAASTWRPARMRQLAARHHEQIAGLVGAETFAAVDPAQQRQAGEGSGQEGSPTVASGTVMSFSSPRNSGNRRLPQFERDGVQVWSVDV